MRASALLLLAAACAGCSGGEDRKQPSGDVALSPAEATRVEVAWLEDVDAWYTYHWENSDGSDCLATYRRDVKPAPTSRVKRLQRMVERACRHFQRGFDFERRAFQDGESELAGIASREFRRGERLMDRVGESLYLVSGAHRPLPVLGGEVATSRIEPRLTAVATRLAGRRTELRCWSKEDWKLVNSALPDAGAFAIRPGDLSGGGPSVPTAHLGPSTCAPLVALAYSGARPTGGNAEFEMAAAVATLAHEAEHLGGTEDEAVAECHAVQRVREAASELGADVAYADRLARRYWRDGYDALDPDYGSGECRNGGALDLHPARSTWP